LPPKKYGDKTTAGGWRNQKEIFLKVLVDVKANQSNQQLDL